MESFVDVLVRKPLHAILVGLGHCKKRKRHEFEGNEPEPPQYMKTNSIYYKKHQPPSNLLYSQGLSSVYSLSKSENQHKKIKLSMSESDFLKIREKRINIELPEEIPNGFGSQIKPYNSIERKNSGITFHANEFKLFKAPNSKNLEIKQKEHTSIPIGQRRIFSLKSKARLGDKENPIIAEDGYEEESKSDIAQKEAESDLLDELDRVTKNISIISFDGLGSPITSDKDFDEKPSTSTVKKFQHSSLDKRVDETYQNEVGDMLFEKIMEDKRNYPLITMEQYIKVKNIWTYTGNSAQNVVSHPHISQVLSYKNLKTLSGRSWLNDEVINAYISLLNKRDSENLQNRIFIFNTFFYQNLESSLKSGSLDKVYRITKRAKVNVSECTKLMIPLNINNNHWTFVHVDLINKSITYHDSMRSSKLATKIMSDVKKYVEGALVHEGLEDNQNLSTQVDHCYPQQDNSSDCGVFMLKGLDYFSRNLIPNFCAHDMPYFRILITLELILGRLLTPNI